VTYFVTWRLARAQQELDASERALVAEAIRKFDGRYKLAAYVVTDDRVVYHLYHLTDEQSRAIEEARRWPARKRTRANSVAESGA
jgi:hypothetical protein